MRVRWPGGPRKGFSLVLRKAGQEENTHDAYNRPSCVLTAPQGSAEQVNEHCSICPRASVELFSPQGWVLLARPSKSLKSPSADPHQPRVNPFQGKLSSGVRAGFTSPPAGPQVNGLRDSGSQTGKFTGPSSQSSLRRL